jgi:hypothetical protein
MMNSGENTLDSLEHKKKKKKVNSECQCRVMNRVERHAINSDKQLHRCSPASKKLMVEGSIISAHSRNKIRTSFSGEVYLATLLLPDFDFSHTSRKLGIFEQ